MKTKKIKLTHLCQHIDYKRLAGSSGASVETVEFDDASDSCNQVVFIQDKLESFLKECGDNIKACGLIKKIANEKYGVELYALPEAIKRAPLLGLSPMPEGMCLAFRKLISEAIDLYEDLISSMQVYPKTDVRNFISNALIIILDFYTLLDSTFEPADLIRDEIKEKVTHYKKLLRDYYPDKTDEGKHALAGILFKASFSLHIDPPSVSNISQGDINIPQEVIDLIMGIKEMDIVPKFGDTKWTRTLRKKYLALKDLYVEHKLQGLKDTLNNNPDEFFLKDKKTIFFSYACIERRISCCEKYLRLDM